MPIEYLQTFDDALAEAASSDYVIIGMLAGFAILALVLASTGLFGVVSYAVAQRTAEFGTRMALGARAATSSAGRAGVRARCSRSVWRSDWPAASASASTMKSVLFGLSPADPLTLAIGDRAVVAGDVTATALPAWRASRIDPVVALRSE